MNTFNTWQVFNNTYLESIPIPTIYIGCMTGTSADKYADFTLAIFDDNDIPAALHYYSYELPEILVNELKYLSKTKGNKIDVSTRALIEAKFSNYLSEAYLTIIKQFNLDNYPKNKIILSPHGLTIEHNPNSEPPFCDIIVNGDVIARTTGYTVVSRHRQMPLVVSMAAPLAPVLLKNLFYNEAVDRVILNGGGIANICVLYKSNQKPMQGYDTGPANGPIDSLIQYIINNCQNEISSDAFTEIQKNKFDNQGKLASSGNVIKELLVEYLNHPYFQRNIKNKSADRSDFELDWILPTGQNHNYKIIDVLCTLAEAIAISISDAIIYSLKLNSSQINAEVLVYGGLNKNTYIIERIFYHLDKVGNFRAITMDKHSPDHIESLLMAYLGYCAYNQKHIDLSYCARKEYEKYGQAVAIPGSLSYP